jgi:hypothetical protein
VNVPADLRPADRRALAHRTITTCLRADIHGEQPWKDACDELAAFQFRGLADVGYVCATSVWHWSQQTGSSTLALVTIIRDDVRQKVPNDGTLARAERCVTIIREFLREPRKPKQLDSAIRAAGQDDLGVQSIAMMSWIGGVIATAVATAQGMTAEQFLTLHALDEQLEGYDGD